MRNPLSNHTNNKKGNNQLIHFASKAINSYNIPAADKYMSSVYAGFFRPSVFYHVSE